MFNYKNHVLCIVIMGIFHTILRPYYLEAPEEMLMKSGNKDHEKHEDNIPTSKHEVRRIPVPNPFNTDYSSWISNRFNVNQPNLEDVGILQWNVISSELMHEFRQNVYLLQKDLEGNDFHWDVYPTHKVLNLIDMSLYNFASGVTRVRDVDSGLLTPLLIEPTSDVFRVYDPDFSPNHQVLPTDVQIDPITKKSKFVSYINNLNPVKYSKMYASLGKILDEAVFPAFNKILSMFGSGEEVNLLQRNLQIAINLKSIELDKQKPSYPGSSWHIEGLKNEHIVTSAIFYFDQLNIKTTELKLRVLGTGVDSNFSSNSVEVDLSCLPGSLIAFPNIYFHKVNSFNLDKGAERGHRKALVFMLLDPNRRIPSTTNVPPQQSHWNQIVKPADNGSQPLNVGFTYGLKKAKVYRLGFQDERGARQCCGGGRRD